MKVSDLHRHPHRLFTAQAEETLDEAADRMSWHQVGALPVFEGQQLVGIITERDLTAAIAEGADPAGTPVSDYMTAAPTVLGPDSELAEAAHKMLELGVRHLPLVQTGRLVGVLSIRDLRRAGSGRRASPAARWRVGDTRRAPPGAVRADHHGDGVGRGPPRTGHQVVEDPLGRGPLQGTLGAAAGSQRRCQCQGHGGHERRRGRQHDRPHRLLVRPNVRGASSLPDAAAGAMGRWSRPSPALDPAVRGGSLVGWHRGNHDSEAAMTTAGGWVCVDGDQAAALARAVPGVVEVRWEPPRG
jgi:CBS domain-containing protein